VLVESISRTIIPSFEIPEFCGHIVLINRRGWCESNLNMDPAMLELTLEDF
jgi:hypothetical protein